LKTSSWPKGCLWSNAFSEVRTVDAGNAEAGAEGSTAGGESGIEFLNFLFTKFFSMVIVFANFAYELRN
jgi:hypothetical protein